MSAALATLTERVYVSQFTTAVFGVTVRKAGEPADADGNVVVRLIEEASGNTIATLTATHVQTGDYQITLISSHTAQTGLYTLRWEYAIDGTPEEFESYIEVGPSNPAYDDLDEDFKDLVDTVWLKFADSYDSPGGGPHAQVHLQSHFSRGRFAQLLRTAVGRLGVIQPPKTVYTLSADEGKKFPLATWGWVLEQALFCVEPSTPVLRDDLQWVPAGEIEVGDRLVAFDEDLPGGKFRTTEVQVAQEQVKSRVRVSTSMGDIIVTPDHRFVVRYPSATHRSGPKEGETVYKRRWVEAQDLRPGIDEIVTIGEPWSHDENYETGYLAAMMDGEGCLTFTPQSRGAESRQSRLFFSQKAGDVMEKTKHIAKSMGFEMAESYGASSNVLHVRGGMTEQMRFLGTIRPVRLLNHPDLPALWEGRAMRQQVLPSAHVLEVTPTLDGPVSVLQTDTGTFIAKGMLSHNCEVLKHLIRTYTEQPEVVGVNVARTDRRDYVRRWETVLTMEQRELDSALDLFKVQHMGLGSASIMVSGGVYGRYAPTRVAHSAAARPRYYARFYA